MNDMTMVIELEKKFLIEFPDLDLISKFKPVKYEIEQIYLLSDTGSRRIRRLRNGDSTKFIETIKVRINGSKCYEYEREISKEDYELFKADADPQKRPIIKDRYCFPYKNKIMELDVYPFWKDKAILEIELEDEQDLYFIPEEIKVLKDVSDDKRYKNNYLAGHLTN